MGSGSKSLLDLLVDERELAVGELDSVGEGDQILSYDVGDVLQLLGSKLAERRSGDLLELGNLSLDLGSLESLHTLGLEIVEDTVSLHSLKVKLELGEVTVEFLLANL